MWFKLRDSRGVGCCRLPKILRLDEVVRPRRGRGRTGRRVALEAIALPSQMQKPRLQPGLCKWAAREQNEGFCSTPKLEHGQFSPRGAGSSRRK